MASHPNWNNPSFVVSQSSQSGEFQQFLEELTSGPALLPVHGLQETNHAAYTAFPFPNLTMGAYPALPTGFEGQGQGLLIQPQIQQQQQQFGYFDSILFQDQQAFVAELEREQQQQQEMGYQCLPSPQDQGVYGGGGGCVALQHVYPSYTYQENADTAMSMPIPAAPTPPVEVEPESELDDKPQITIHHGGPNSATFPGIDSDAKNDPSFSLLPPPRLHKQFVMLHHLLARDPSALDVLPPILVQELTMLEYRKKKLAFVAIFYPIEEIFPGVYKLLFHIRLSKTYQSRFDISVTDDYPAEAPVVNFDTTFIPPNTLAKIRRGIASLPFSFRINDIVVEWVKVCFEAFRAKLLRDRILLNKIQTPAAAT